MTTFMESYRREKPSRQQFTPSRATRAIDAGMAREAALLASGATDISPIDFDAEMVPAMEITTIELVLFPCKDKTFECHLVIDGTIKGANVRFELGRRSMKGGARLKLEGVRAWLNSIKVKQLSREVGNSRAGNQYLVLKYEAVTTKVNGDWPEMP